MSKLLGICMCSLVGNRSSKGLRISKQLKYYKELNEMQWNSIETNREIQKEKIYDCAIHAIKKVPYYRDLGFSEEDFTKENIYEDIKKLPILTKDIIRQKGDLMHSEDVDDWTYLSTSGGTTGEPVSFIHSGTAFDYDQAGKILFDSWCGRGIGDKQIRLWGSERDIISGKKDWLNKIYRRCRGEVFLNTFSMTEKDLRDYINRINKYNPKMILAYVQSAREVARFAKEKGIGLETNCKGVMTSAGTLDKDTYNLLKEVYKCPILNRYGSREVGDMACSCDKNEGLHINMRTAYIEIVDDEGNECKPGEKGNIIVTSLTESAMPLIRYYIGDYGAKTENKCSCGRGLEMLQTVNGRVVDIFKTPDGRKVDGEYFTHLFYLEKSIKQFQVIQDKLDHINVKIVTGDTVPEEFYERMKYGVGKVFGSETTIDFEIVDDIPNSPSGKRIYTISLV